jgi:hypothetical protein
MQTARKPRAPREPHPGPSVPPLRVQVDQAGRSVGEFVLSFSAAGRLRVALYALRLEQRALLLYGPEGAGKTETISQVAALIGRPLLTMPRDVTDGQERTVLVVGGKRYETELSAAQRTMIASALGAGAILHVQEPQLELQRALGDSLRPGSPDSLAILVPQSNDPAAGVTRVQVHHRAAVAVELDTAEAPHASLEFAALREFAPIQFGPLDPEVRDELALGHPKHRAEWAAPEPGGIDAGEDMHVPTSIPPEDGPRRQQTLSRLHAALSGLSPTATGWDAYRFLDRVLRVCELGAYEGDEMAAQLASECLQVLVPDSSDPMVDLDRESGLSAYLRELVPMSAAG